MFFSPPSFGFTGPQSTIAEEVMDTMPFGQQMRQAPVTVVGAEARMQVTHSNQPVVRHCDKR